MTFRPARRTRQPAVPMAPVVDPAGWQASDLAANEDWIYELSDDQIAEVTAAVEELERRGVDIKDAGRDDFEMPRLDAALATLYDELLEGRGFALIRGLPIDVLGKPGAAAAFWGIGTRFGRAVSQNRKGHVLGHVKDFGGDYADANVRGYQTRVQMTYHSDQCDYVALLCMHPARSGGRSLIASTLSIYNQMLEESPDLAEALIGAFAQTRHGEVPPGEKPWYMVPVFSFHEGYFSARGAGAHLLKANDIPGAPKLNDTHFAAIRAFQDVAARQRFEMDFRPGDIQILHNHLMVHTRTEFEDWPEPERKRHLMRLWLSDWSGRPLVPGFRENIQGITVEGTTPSAPIDSFEPA